MKKLIYLIVSIIFVSVLPAKSEARALPRTPIHKSIRNFLYSPLQMRERNLKKEKYLNTVVRKSNGYTIPVYLIMGPKSSQRTVDRSPTNLEKLFDSKGMIYVTDPKAARFQQPRISILGNVGRRSRSSDMMRDNQRTLRSYMNVELNKQLRAKNAARRFIKKYDKEYNFNDLVM